MLVSTIEDCLLVKPFEVLLLGLTHPTFLLQIHTLNNCPLVIINNEPVRNHYNTMFSFKFLILPCIIINQLLTGTLCMLFRPRHFACQSCFVYRSYPHHLLGSWSNGTWTLYSLYHIIIIFIGCFILTKNNK